MKSGARGDGGEGGELEKVRQATVDRLCERFAEDGLSMDEFERRVDLAQKATATRQLASLVADLAAAAAPPPRTDSAAAPAAGASGRMRRPGAGGDGVHGKTVPPERVPSRQFLAGVLGASARGGTWVAPRELYVVALMGGVDLDFREAGLGPGVTEVTVFALCGGVDVVVPPGLPVECNGVGIMGGFEHKPDEPAGAAAGVPDPGGTVLKVNGVALMGGVTVSVRLAGESERDAARRRKLARKARRRELRGW